MKLTSKPQTKSGEAKPVVGEKLTSKPPAQSGEAKPAVGEAKPAVGEIVVPEPPFHVDEFHRKELQIINLQRINKEIEDLEEGRVTVQTETELNKN